MSLGCHLPGLNSIFGGSGRHFGSLSPSVLPQFKSSQERTWNEFCILSQAPISQLPPAFPRRGDFVLPKKGLSSFSWNEKLPNQSFLTWKFSFQHLLCFYSGSMLVPHIGFCIVVVLTMTNRSHARDGNCSFCLQASFTHCRRRKHWSNSPLYLSWCRSLWYPGCHCREQNALLPFHCGICQMTGYAFGSFGSFDSVNLFI